MTTTTTPRTDWAGLWRSGHLKRFLILCIGVWLHAASGHFMATILPTVIREIGGGHLVSWTSALYEIGSIVAGVLAGFIAERRGVRTVVLTATLAFFLGSAICALAPAMQPLLAGRLLQGIGGGAMIALTVIYLRRSFPEKIWPQLIAVQSAVWGTSAFCGPFIGALFATYADWRWGFWAFALQAAAFGLFMIPITRQSTAPTQSPPDSPAARPFPVIGLGLLIAGIVLIATASIAIRPWQSPLLVAAGVTLLIIFIKRDSTTATAPLLPSRPFALNTQLGQCMILTVSLSMSIIAFSLYGPVIMAEIYDATPLTIGYLIVLESVGWTLAAIAFANAPPALERKLIRASAIIVMAANAAFAWVMPNGPFWALLPIAFAEGAACGAAWAFIIRRIVSTAPQTEKDRASSATTAVQRAGFAIGAAIAGIIANWAGFATAINLASAKVVGFWLFTLFIPIAAAGVFAAWRLTAETPQQISSQN